MTKDLIDRVSGPMRFRLILQPVMAVIFAIRAGLKDAKEGRPPYFWASSPIQLKDGNCCGKDGGLRVAFSSSQGPWTRSTSSLFVDVFIRERR